MIFLSFLFSVEYKLIKYSEINLDNEASKGLVSSCHKGCSTYGLVFMPLDNAYENYIRHVTSLPDYKAALVVYTDGIEVYNGTSSYFSRPGGNKVNSLSITDDYAHVRTNVQNGNFCIALYHHALYSRQCSIGDGNLCACKAKGNFTTFCVLLSPGRHFSLRRCPRILEFA